MPDNQFQTLIKHHANHSNCMRLLQDSSTNHTR